MGGIYKLSCSANGKYYIGRTQDFVARKQKHLTSLRGNRHKNPVVQSCYNKYGESSFVFEVLVVAPKALQEEIEQRLLDQNIIDPLCMNVNRSAKTFCDVPMTEQRKQRIRDANKGRKRPVTSEAWCKALSDALQGHKLSEETKRKIGEKQRGHKMPEHNKKILLARNSGKNNACYGRTGAKNPLSRPVVQFNKDTLEVIAYFESAKDAGDAIGGDPSYILKVCKGKEKQAKGFVWRYREPVTTIPKGSRAEDESLLEARSIS